MTGQQKREWVEEMAACRDEDAVVLDGYDDAILALTEVNGQTVVIYDHQKLVEITMRRDGGDHVEALEWVDYNIGNMPNVLMADVPDV